MPKITYYASDDTMGDNSPEDCNAFRNWALQQLVAEYPDFDVEVSPSNSLRQVAVTDATPEMEDSIEFYASHLWDRCPWDWKD